MNSGDDIISLTGKGLAFSRSGRTLFSDLDVQAGAGSLLQISGTNGSGKTTLLRVLCGLIPPDSGTVLWRGQPLEHVCVDYHADLSYLGHKDGLKSDLTAWENLEFASDMSFSKQTVSADDALERFGVSDCRDVLCHELSAGQRRRIALARLTVAGARLWILDEPTASLDDAGVATLGELIVDHVEGGGMALVALHGSPEWADRADCLELGYA